MKRAKKRQLTWLERREIARPKYLRVIKEKPGTDDTARVAPQHGKSK